MKTKREIKSVKGLCIGQVFNVEGINYIVTRFPTRTSVCAKNQNPLALVGEPSNIKTSINHTKTMFWNHHKTGNTICPVNPI